ncbi:MAG: hypothetical protein ACKOW3_06125 [Hyphomicrobium sp.]
MWPIGKKGQIVLNNGGTSKGATPQKKIKMALCGPQKGIARTKGGRITLRDENVRIL